MRTPIDIDDTLLAEAQRLSGQKTKKATVEETLRLLVRLRRQGEVASAFGRYPWSGDLDRSRLGRRGSQLLLGGHALNQPHGPEEQAR